MPFCARKCPYCAFFSVAFSHLAAEEYVCAVIRNLEHYRGQGIAVDSIYCGGGTPSLLSTSQWVRILATAKSAFAVTSDAEITLEANPSLTSEERYGGFLAASFNRISFGVQSLVDSELKSLGRLHDSATAVRAVENAYDAGFREISADLMLGIIGQSFPSLDSSIAHLCALPLTHISAYLLSAEDETPYSCEEILAQLPTEDDTADLYLRAVEKLKKNGFLQYEISNFAKNGSVSRHNLHYWRCEEYIGIGPSAHSYYKGARFFAPERLQDFLESPLQGREITDENGGTQEEKAMLGLRLCGEFGLSASAEGIKREELPWLEKMGLLKLTDGRISLTAKGCLLSNTVIGKLLI